MCTDSRPGKEYAHRKIPRKVVLCLFKGFGHAFPLAFTLNGRVWNWEFIRSTFWCLFRLPSDKGPERAACWYILWNASTSGPTIFGELISGLSSQSTIVGRWLDLVPTTGWLLLSTTAWGLPLSTTAGTLCCEEVSPSLPLAIPSRSSWTGMGRAESCGSSGGGLLNNDLISNNPCPSSKSLYISKVNGSRKSVFVAVCIFAPESRTANTVLRICALLFLAVAPNDKYVTLPGDMRACEKSLSSLDVFDISSELWHCSLPILLSLTLGFSTDREESLVSWLTLHMRHDCADGIFGLEWWHAHVIGCVCVHSCSREGESSGCSKVSFVTLVPGSKIVRKTEGSISISSRSCGCMTSEWWLVDNLILLSSLGGFCVIKAVASLAFSLARSEYSGVGSP